jgi:Heavy metal associated domain 2
VIIIEQVKDYPDESSVTSPIEVIHSIEGRIRVRIIWLQYYPVLQQRLETSIANWVWVTAVNSSLATNSITIYYQHQQIKKQTLLVELSRLVQQITPATHTTEQITKTYSPSPLQTIGSRVVGSSVGKMMGIGIGSVTGGILLGPLGLLAGGGIGSVVGQTLGGQIARDLLEENPPQQDLQDTLQRGGTEIMGEAIGAVVGGVVGATTLGFPGLMVGRIIGGAIGSQVGEDVWSNQSYKK